MRNTTALIALGAMVLFSTGCANGPIRKWICGGNCNTPPAVTYPGAFANPGCSTCNTAPGGNPAVTNAPFIGQQNQGGLPTPGTNGGVGQ